MQKIKGEGYTLDRKQEHIYTFNRNTVYQYRLSDLKLLKSFKSLSYIYRLSLSNNEKQLAVTNTSGTIAVHSAETGEILGKSRMGRRETFFTYYMEDGSGILCADWNGKIMRLDTSNFRHEVLLDLKYTEGMNPLLLDTDKMQIVEVVNDDVRTELNVYNVSDMQLWKQDYTGVVDHLTDQMLFGKGYYINLNDYAGHNDITFFNQMGVLHKVSLPVKYNCNNYNISKSRRYLVFSDSSAISGYFSTKILDLYSNKVVKTYHVKYVDDMLGSALQFIHNDTELLIPSWEGIYFEPLNLP